jgi:hypothetical protein
VRVAILILFGLLGCSQAAPRFSVTPVELPPATSTSTGPPPIASASAKPAHPKLLAHLRIDGMYTSPEDGHTAYLRFESSGLACSVGSTGTPKEVKSWFVCATQSHGEYTRGADGAVRFRSHDDTGDVDYEIVVVSDRELDVKIHSLINGYKAQRRYTFVADG